MHNMSIDVHKLELKYLPFNAYNAVQTLFCYRFDFLCGTATAATCFINRDVLFKPVQYITIYYLHCFA